MGFEILDGEWLTVARPLPAGKLAFVGTAGQAAPKAAMRQVPSLAAHAVQNDADFVLSRMVLALRAANIAHQLFGWHPGSRVGGAEDFWLIFTPPGVSISQKSSGRQIISLVP